MNEKIFCAYGIDIVKRDGFFYIQYNDGSLVGKELEFKITEDETLKSQKSPKDASELILLTQKKMGSIHPDFKISLLRFDGVNNYFHRA